MSHIPKHISIITLAALTLFALIYQLPRTVRIDIGSVNDEPLISGEERAVQRFGKCDINTHQGT